MKSQMGVRYASRFTRSRGGFAWAIDTVTAMTRTIRTGHMANTVTITMAIAAIAIRAQARVAASVRAARTIVMQALRARRVRIPATIAARVTIMDAGPPRATTRVIAADPPTCLENTIPMMA